MEIEVTRREFTDRYTVGDLYIDGDFFCNTLEDTVREPGIKIPKETAIPGGRYELRMTYSQRFKKVTPQVMNVQNFEGIRLHPGVNETHSEGCLLLGIDSRSGWLIKSRDTYNDFIAEIERVKEPIYITIN